jgi:DNA mismatch repair protein MSH4
VEKLAAPEFRTVLFEASEKYYALAATAALLQYVQHIQNTIFARESLRVHFCHLDKTTMIDASSVKHLELLQSARDPKDTKHSLYGVLNLTATVAGGKLEAHRAPPLR